jgi:prevent-host-death family protein
MSTHSIDEAETRLSELIERALAGEGVVITRDGEPVVELKPVAGKLEAKATGPKRRWTKEEELEWLRAHRARLTPAKIDSVTLIRQMRDEGEG